MRTFVHLTSLTKVNSKEMPKPWRSITGKLTTTATAYMCRWQVPLSGTRKIIMWPSTHLIPVNKASMDMGSITHSLENLQKEMLTGVTECNTASNEG